MKKTNLRRMTMAAMMGAIAFVLNVPMRAIENGVLRKQRVAEKARRPLALMFTLPFSLS